MSSAKSGPVSFQFGRSTAWMAAINVFADFIWFVRLKKSPCTSFLWLLLSILYAFHFDSIAISYMTNFINCVGERDGESNVCKQKVSKTDLGRTTLYCFYFFIFSHVEWSDLELHPLIVVKWVHPKNGNNHSPTSLWNNGVVPFVQPEPKTIAQKSTRLKVFETMKRPMASWHLKLQNLPYSFILEELCVQV